MALTREDLQAIRAIMKEEIKESESVLLDEIERLHNAHEERLTKLDKRLDRIEETVNATKLENDIVNILVKTVKELEQRIVIIENKIA